VDETNLSKATILSPIDGIVLERSVEPGQTVAASLQAPILFSLAEDLTKMELNVDVDEADVGRVREGQPAFFTVDAYPGETFSALVTQVRFAAKTESGVVTYATLLSVENQDLKLRPGMTATADIRVQEVTDALLAPNRALRYKPPAPETEENGDLLSRIFPWRRPRAARKTPTHRKGEEEGQTVWILRNNEPVPVKIRLGVTDGDSTQVLSGDLAPGTPLIVEEVKKPS
ncbi:MAG: efflux RND transporter periplasmic adaptor subunit, partial [Pseudomonadota bacterium]